MRVHLEEEEQSPSQEAPLLLLFPIVFSSSAIHQQEAEEQFMVITVEELQFISQLLYNVLLFHSSLVVESLLMEPLSPQKSHKVHSFPAQEDRMAVVWL